MRKMAFKIALIAVVCFVQVFADETLDGAQTKPPCETKVPESAEEIPHDFEETIHEMDEIREIVSMATMEAYFNGTDPDIIMQCFKQQRGSYMKLGAQINGMMRKAAKDMATELGDKYEKYAERAAEPFKTIGLTMKMFPQQMWMHIREKEFGKALEVMRESRRVIETNARELNKIIKDMAKEVPESAKKAEEMAREIRETARNGCKAIGEAFRKCVEEGGPKGHIEDDVEVQMELEQFEV